MSKQDMDQVFSRNVKAWRVKNLHIRVFGARMAFEQPLQSANVTSIDRPFWMSYVDNQFYFMNQGVQPLQDSFTGENNTNFGLPSEGWSINPKADIHEYVWTDNSGPVPLTTPKPLYRLKDWFPGQNLIQDTRSLSPTEMGTMLMTSTSNTGVSIPYFYKEIESLGEWTIHEPGATFEWSWSNDSGMYNYQPGGYWSAGEQLYNKNNMPQMDLGGPLPNNVDTYQYDYNTANMIDYILPNGTGFFVSNPAINGNIEDQRRNVVEQRYQIPSILVKIPLQTNSAGNTINARCDIYVTYSCELEVIYGRYATTNNPNIVRFGRRLQSQIIGDTHMGNYSQTGPYLRTRQGMVTTTNADGTAWSVPADIDSRLTQRPPIGPHTIS